MAKENIFEAKEKYYPFAPHVAWFLVCFRGSRGSWWEAERLRSQKDRLPKKCGKTMGRLATTRLSLHNLRWNTT
jgi:hypothetical protein